MKTRLTVAVALAFWGAVGSAQSTEAAFDVGTIQSAVLVVEFERAFEESAYGKRFLHEMEDAGAEIAAENRQIETELKNEELALTAQRTSLEPSAFRDLAEAFDEKVQSLRQEQDTKARALGQRREAARREFLTVARPVLNQIMQDSGAVVILEKRSVFVSISSIDVTDQVVAGINVLLGQGTDGAAAPSDP